MNIERQKTAQKIEVPKREMFDVCLKMNQLAFQPSRRDDALFYLRPDCCIQQKDFDAIRNEWGRPYLPNIQELPYIPTEADLFHALESDLEQLTHTNSAGWFAYTNVQTEENAPIIRGQGENPWFALADAWIKVQEWKLKTD